MSPRPSAAPDIMGSKQQSGQDTRTSGGVAEKSPAKDIITWFPELLKTISAGVAFLAGFLLTFASANLDAVPHATRVRVCAGWGSALFLVTFTLCGGLTLMLQFNEERLIEAWDQEHRGWRLFTRINLSLMSLAVQMLFMVGVILALVLLLSFVKGAAIFGLVLTGLLTVCALVVWMWQICGIGKPPRETTEARRQRVRCQMAESHDPSNTP
ncbi:hypothetical protein KC332_g3877 [Hortaea werneckii]|nr:hypothetical protein KC350_g2986 [Hortaea werneckii]KAI6849188.1 hypothetical protein KC358_g1307 [Hortaea werneckii]KAI6938890.1 hypothetical protein KC341_g4600 [Hortaea werneckii]KAI6946591.1 hypothetical protein KC348_g3050 [Hortaea werneckii]KAI6977899.1 hypothetical protein KC321_g3204 [Hortaea werneckii]